MFYFDKIIFFSFGSFSATFWNCALIVSDLLLKRGNPEVFVLPCTSMRGGGTSPSPDDGNNRLIRIRKVTRCPTGTDGVDQLLQIEWTIPTLQNAWHHQLTFLHYMTSLFHSITLLHDIIRIILYSVDDVMLGISGIDGAGTGHNPASAPPAVF